MLYQNGMETTFLKKLIIIVISMIEWSSIKICIKSESKLLED